jgi:hypothetical protein
MLSENLELALDNLFKPMKTVNQFFTCNPNCKTIGYNGSALKAILGIIRLKNGLTMQ